MSKLRITPVGTCRIHSPLRRAILRYPVELDLARNYGFVHTSSEALQMVRFLQGEKHFGTEALPYIVRNPADLPELQAQRWDGTDLALVEISSAKSIRLGDDFVQINYLTKEFADFFSNPQRARTYWSLAKLTDRGRLINFVREECEALGLPQARQDILLRLQPEQQAFKSIMADMDEIAERVGRDRILFVTHVNAVGPDDNVIPSRDRLIRWVTLAAEKLGLPVYDPTPAMQEFGQERALEKGGLDLTHYTPVFFDRIYDDLHRSFVGAQVQAKVGGSGVAESDNHTAMIAANFEAMLELGDFFAAARDVHAALDQAPDAPALLGLRGLIRARVGDYRRAAEDFAKIKDEATLSHPMQVAHLQTLNALGDYRGALAIAERLFAEEFASADLYSGAASAAEKTGNPDLAITYAKQAFRSDPSDLAVALKALQLLIAQGREEEAASWRREVRENSSGTSSRAFEVCTWAVHNRDPDLFAASLRSVAKADKGGTVDLLEDAFAAGLYKAVAGSVPSLVALGRVSRSLAERRVTLLDRLLETGSQLLNKGDVEGAWSIARAMAGLEGASNSQLQVRALAAAGKRLGQAVVAAVRELHRTALAEGRLDEVGQLAGSWGEIIAADPITAVTAARGLSQRGQNEQALALLKAALVHSPDNITLLRFAGRLAHRTDDMLTATRSYGRLRRDFVQQKPQLAPEIESFFKRAPVLGARQLRNLTLAGRLSEAVELAELLTAELPPSERLELEVNRMYRALRIRLREIDGGEGSLEGREQLLRKLVRVRPDDQQMLRRLAVELMRQFRFAEAADVWGRLLALDPANEAAERSHLRCQTLAARGQHSAELQLEGEA